MNVKENNRELDGGALVTAEPKSLGERLPNILIDWFPVIALVVVFAFFYIVSKGKLVTQYNLQIIFSQSFLYILGGLGASFLFAQGAFDLSMGSTIALSAILGTYASQINPVFGVVVALSVGIFVGAINGCLYAYSGIPVFILGLSMSFLIKGLLLPILNNASSIKVNTAIPAISSNALEAIIIVAALLLFGYLFNYTTLGKQSKAIGAAETAAVQSGVNVKKIKITAYIISGLMAGFVAFMIMVRTGAAGSTTGTMFEFNVMIAMVIGGMPTTGGAAAKLRSAILGSLIVAIMANGMVLWGVSSRVQEIVKGVIFIAVVVSTTKFRDKLRS